MATGQLPWMSLELVSAVAVKINAAMPVVGSHHIQTAVPVHATDVHCLAWLL